MIIFKVTKDPDGYLDYGLDWADWLNADTVSQSEWLVSGPDSTLTVEQDFKSDTETVAWVLGGTLGNTYLLTNRITTVAGRIDDRTIIFTIRDR